MKKQLLLILLVGISFCAKAQFGFLNMKFYDSVAVEAPKFKLRNTVQGSVSDSLLVKTASNWEVKRLAVNQLPFASTAALATKENTITAGTSSQYWRGDKTWQTLPIYSAGTGISIASGIISNTSPDQTVSLTGANGITTGGTYPNFTITQYLPTINSNVTRPINSTTFTVSTKQAFVSYNITISCTATIGSASTGSVALQYSINSGSTWITVGTLSNSNTVTLAVVLNSVQVSGGQLSGYIPANALVRLVSTTTGTTINTYITGQETY